MLARKGKIILGDRALPCLKNSYVYKLLCSYTHLGAIIYVNEKTNFSECYFSNYKDDAADILLHKYKYRPIVQLLKFEKRFPEGYIFETEKKKTRVSIKHFRVTACSWEKKRKEEDMIMVAIGRFCLHHLKKKKPFPEIQVKRELEVKAPPTVP